MQIPFNPDEPLFRAVKPTNIYWKDDGTVSSAAFKDSQGASVDRLGDRLESDAVNALHHNMPTSGIISVTYQNCLDVNAVVQYKPKDTNLYHSEIHGSNTKVKLTSSQCKNLIKKALIRLKPNV